MALFENLVPLMQFDIIEARSALGVETGWEDMPLIKFDIERHEKMMDQIFSQILDIGYDSFNYMVLLNTLAIMVMFYCLKVIIYNFLKLFIKITKNKKAKKLAIAMGKEMIYSELIGLCIGGLMEFIIASYLTLSFGEYKTSGEKMSLALTYLTMIILFIWLPFVLCLLIFKFDTKSLDNENFKQMWGQAYEDLNYKNKSARAYYLIFFFRRILYIFCCFYINKDFII